MRVAVEAWKHREAIACLGEAMAPDPSCAFVHGACEGGFSGLGPGTRHCLVDTMALLPTCQGDPGVVGGAKLGLHGAAIISYCWTGSSARPRTGTASLLVSEYYRTFADMCNAIITYYRTVRFKLDIVRYASGNPKLFCTKLMIGAIDTPVCSKNLLFEGFFSKFGRRPARPFCMTNPNCVEQFHTNAMGAKAVRSPRAHNLTSR